MSGTELWLNSNSCYHFPKHQNLGGRGDPTPQEITSVILLLDAFCEKLSSSLHYFLSLLNIRPGEQIGEFSGIFASSIGKFRDRARTSLLWRVARCEG